MGGEGGPREWWTDVLVRVCMQRDVPSRACIAVEGASMWLVCHAIPWRFQPCAAANLYVHALRIIAMDRLLMFAFISIRSALFTKNSSTDCFMSLRVCACM